MFTDAHYFNGWLIYYAGAFVGFLCWWYLLSKLPVRLIRPLLLGAMAGLLFMPWYISMDSDYLAPAWLIAGSEGFFDGAEQFWRAGTPMILAIVLCSIAGFIVQVIAAICSARNREEPAETRRVEPTVS